MQNSNIRNSRTDVKLMVGNTIKVIIGLLVAGIGTAFMYGAGKGSAPAATITEGIAVFSGLSYGISGIILNLSVLAILFGLDKRLINIGTLLATFCFGYFIDLGMFLTSPIGIEQMSFVLKMMMMFAGCVITAIGLGYYIGVDFGSGALDGMSIALSDRLNIKFTYCRWAMDTLWMVIGVLLGASWGMGTIMAIVLTGPIMSIVINKMKK